MEVGDVEVGDFEDGVVEEGLVDVECMWIGLGEGVVGEVNGGEGGVFVGVE